MKTVKLQLTRTFFHFCPLIIVLLMASTPHAAVYTVASTEDCNWPDPDNYCLRTALSAANQHAGTDTILLPQGTYTLSIGGIDDDLNLTGDLDIVDSVTINGAGPGQTVIDAGAIDRVFHIFHILPNPGIIVVMRDLTIQNGQTTEAMVGEEGGAGILNNSQLVLHNVVIRNNSVLGDDSSGGGIANHGTLVLYDTMISDNRAARGGGLFNAGSTEAYIRRSLFRGNEAIRASAIQTFADSMLLENSTIHGNTSFSVGAVEMEVNSAADISFCTITNNTVQRDLEAVLVARSSSSISLNNTILADNLASRNCVFDPGSVLTSAAYNLEDADTCNLSPGTNLLNTDPRLGALRDNGGPTHTRALLPGSPAVDAVKVDTGVTEDQRGEKRPQGGYADIGAYELDPPLCFPVRSGDNKTAIICL